MVEPEGARGVSRAATYLMGRSEISTKHSRPKLAAHFRSRVSSKPCGSGCLSGSRPERTVDIECICVDMGLNLAPGHRTGDWEAGARSWGEGPDGSVAASVTKVINEDSARSG